MIATQVFSFSFLEATLKDLKDHMGCGGETISVSSELYNDKGNTCHWCYRCRRRVLTVIAVQICSSVYVKCGS